MVAPASPWTGDGVAVRLVRGGLGGATRIDAVAKAPPFAAVIVTGPPNARPVRTPSGLTERSAGSLTE
jgi:hypothetical protein